MPVFGKVGTHRDALRDIIDGHHGNCGVMVTTHLIIPNRLVKEWTRLSSHSKTGAQQYQYPSKLLLESAEAHQLTMMTMLGVAAQNR